MSKAVVVAPKAHASLGASVAARWIACPGSVNLSAGLSNAESEHAKIGTAAHALAELCLRHNTEPAAYIETVVEGVVVDDAMAEAVQVFVDFCREKMKTATKYGIEQRFNLAALHPPGPMFGTSDFWSYELGTKTLDVADYKNGSGVVVEAKDNKQLKYYALGAALMMPTDVEIDEVRMHIIQPNAFHPEGVVRSDTISYVDLLAFAGELMDAARATLDPAAPLHAGSHCRWCPASAICPERKRIAQEIALVEFDSVEAFTPPAPETIPLPALAEIVAKLPQLDDWMKSVRAYVADKLAKGEITSAEIGQKLVAKRANRQWANPEEVIEWLSEVKGLTDEEIYNRKLKSPNQIESALHSKKAIPPEMITKVSNGYTMVSVEDKRPELMLDAAREFAALPAGED